MIQVALLVGGASAERAISLWTGEEIYKALNPKKYHVHKIEIPSTAQFQWIHQLMALSPDIAVIGLHGGIGENGAVQGLLECMRIPYIGSKVLASSLSMDKNMSKIVMNANHIPVIDGFFIQRTGHPKKDLGSWSFPLVVKPNTGGSSVGIQIVQTESEFESAVKSILEMDDDIIVEKYIAGQEVACGVIETDQALEVLPVLDISTQRRFYDYQAKYQDLQTQIEFSTLPPFQQRMIEEIAKKTFLCLGCSGYGRVDLIVKEEQVYVIEMNTLPGLTTRSLIPQALKGKEMSFDDFLDFIIERTLHQNTPSCF